MPTVHTRIVVALQHELTRLLWIVHYDPGIRARLVPVFATINLSVFDDLFAAKSTSAALDFPMWWFGWFPFRHTVFKVDMLGWICNIEHAKADDNDYRNSLLLGRVGSSPADPHMWVMVKLVDTVS